MITSISFDVNVTVLIEYSSMPKSKPSPETRDFLIRGLPVELADKLKVAASLHKMPMKDYLRSLLETHLDELEQQGITLTLRKGK